VGVWCPRNHTRQISLYYQRILNWRLAGDPDIHTPYHAARSARWKLQHSTLDTLHRNCAVCDDMGRVSSSSVAVDTSWDINRHHSAASARTLDGTHDLYQLCNARTRRLTLTRS